VRDENRLLDHGIKALKIVDPTAEKARGDVHWGSFPELQPFGIPFNRVLAVRFCVATPLKRS
jgi:hypothetical protein